MNKMSIIVVVCETNNSITILAIQIMWGLLLWCWTLPSTIYQLCRGGQFYWWNKREYPRKPPTYRKHL